MLNALLCGCEYWNIAIKNKQCLEAFHHTAIHSILGIKWNQVREFRIKNETVRKMFGNTPNIIIRRTAHYILKITSAEDTTNPKQIGDPQKSCNSNFAHTIQVILALYSSLNNDSVLFKEWIPLAKNNTIWEKFVS